MTRPIRVQFEDAVYHITARGNERREIYCDDDDRRRFLETLMEACTRFGLVVHTYCLMPNHYHLLVQTPRANLSDAVGWLQTTYTIRFNRRHRRSGHLFQGRFKSHLIDSDQYAQSVITYTHLNPVRPRDKRKPIPADCLRVLDRYVWSSHRAYAGQIEGPRVSPWLCLEWLSYFGRNRPHAHANYRRMIRAMIGSAAKSPWDELRDNLVLGGDGLWSKARALIRQSRGQEELQWSKRAGYEAIARWIDEQVVREPDPRIQMWLLVKLGGRRTSDVARMYGYRYASGVHQAVKRLLERARQDLQLAAALEEYKERLANVKS